MKAKEQEYRLLQESATLRNNYMHLGNYEKSIKMQKRQDEVYKKWKFYNRLRKEMEKKK